MAAPGGPGSAAASPGPGGTAYRPGVGGVSGYVQGGPSSHAPESFSPLPQRVVGAARSFLAAGGPPAGTSTVINGQFIVDANNGNSPYAINCGDTLTVTGNTYVGYSSTGVVNQNGGTFNSAAGADLVLGSGSGASGTYNLNGGTLAAAGVTTGSGSGTLNFNGGTLQALANNDKFVGGTIAANVRNGGAVIDTNGFNVAVAQGFAHSNLAGDNATDGGLTKNGLGTLTLGGANTYTGPTTINAGTLAVASSASIGGSQSNGTFGSGIYFNDTRANATGTLLATADVTLNRDLVIRTDGSATGVVTTAILAAAPGKTLTIQSGGIALNSNAQLVFGSAGNTGTVVLTSPVGSTQGGTFSLTVAAGTLRAGGDFSVPYLTTFITPTIINAGAVLDYNGYDAHTTSFGDDVLRALHGNGTLLTGGNAATNITVGSGNFAGVIGGPGQITKTTYDALFLSGPSTYAGGTTVSTGALIINNATGSGTGTGSVLVNAGAILGGQGKISGPVTVAGGGTLAPGSSVGTLSTGSLRLKAGSTLAMDLDPSRVAAGGDHDQIDVTGILELDNCALKLDLLSAPVLGERFALFLNDGADPVVGTFAQGTTVSLSFDGQPYLFAVDYAANLDGGTVGNDVLLTTLVVPEPSTWAWCGAGLFAGGMVMVRRRVRYETGTGSQVG